MSSAVLRGAIVGFGEVARHGHWPAWSSSSDARIVAVVDSAAERRELAETTIPGVATFATLEDLASEIPVDFVDICTPPARHAAPMIEAIGRGWHVLCEKPFVLERGAIDAVRRRAVERGVAVVPVHNWKHAPILSRATEMLRRWIIGDLTHVVITTERMQAAATADAGGYNWRHDPRLAGGGILFDHGWHSIYLALEWFAAAPGEVRSTLQWPGDGGVEREARLTIQFPKGEAAIVLTWNGVRRSNTARLIGTLGEIVIDDDTLHVSGPFPHSVKFPAPLSAGSHHAEWFADMLPNVVAAFRAPEESRRMLDEADHCLAVIEEAYRVDSSLAAPPR